MRKALLTLIFLFLIPISVSTSNEICIIVNIDSPIYEISRTEVRNIFLGYKNQWEGDTYIKVIKHKYPIDVHIEFIRNYLRMSPSGFFIHWKRLVHTGSHLEPILVEDKFDMLEKVANVNNSIGYIYKNDCNPRFSDRIRRVTVIQ